MREPVRPKTRQPTRQEPRRKKARSKRSGAGLEVGGSDAAREEERGYCLEVDARLVNERLTAIMRRGRYGLIRDKLSLAARLPKD